MLSSSADCVFLCSSHDPILHFSHIITLLYKPLSMGSQEWAVWRARDGAGRDAVLYCLSQIIISGLGGACTNAKRCMQWREYGSLNEVFEEDRSHGSPVKDLTSSSTVLLAQ
ncbi:hypothetical protein DdX_12295 [Ditylenchus destructor]|uniref:Uncharacterized protein n=1 Tax=Ditylenchus destructor TaxID=166010 RepID=A0AAD4QXH8_9BILA|nr:hypothetical protein DdX_12295 [Ditylenchus destructor]